VDNEILILT
jgi:protocatechuate 3,4-dioxygenase beta subunit